MLDEGNRLAALAERLEADGDEEGAWAIRERLNVIRAQYTELLPEVTVARCPHSGDIVNWPIDVVDLDGWFWDYHTPARRLPTSLPKLWLAMTGAMRMNRPIATAPFMCRPGPGAPYVVPRILTAPDVRAVIAEIPVGPHTGWAISYFGPRPIGVELENVWGTQEYFVCDNDGRWLGWAENPPWPADYDFDLEPWLTSGKLLWIAPGDGEARLREGAERCPYVGIDGPHTIAIIEDGAARYPAPR